MFFNLHIFVLFLKESVLFLKSAKISLSTFKFVNVTLQVWNKEFLMLWKSWRSWYLSFLYNRFSVSIGLSIIWSISFSQLLSVLYFCKLSRWPTIRALSSNSKSTLILELSSLLTDIVIRTLGSHPTFIHILFIDIFNKHIGLSVPRFSVVLIFTRLLLKKNKI